MNRVLSALAFPVVFCVTVGGAAYALWAGVDTVPITTVSFVFVLLLSLLLERLFPYDSDPERKPKVAIELLNSAVNLLVIGRIVRPLLAIAIIRLSVALTGSSGLLPAEWFGPWWIQGILAFLLTDLSRYVVHRTQHRTPALWMFHKVHHSVQKVRTFNLQFSHPVDYVVRNVFTFYVPVLLGLSEEGIVFGTVIQYATGVPSHLNANLRFGPLNYVFATCRIHRWHHALDIEDGGDANFGNGLTLWDQLFGTFHHPTDRDGPEGMGVEEGPPRSVGSTLFKPLA